MNTETTEFSMTISQRLSHSSSLSPQQQKQQKQKQKQPEGESAYHWSISSEPPNNWTELLSSGNSRRASISLRNTRNPTEQRTQSEIVKSNPATEKVDGRRLTWVPSGEGAADVNAALHSNFSAAEYIQQQQQHSDTSSSESEPESPTQMSELSPRLVSSSEALGSSTDADGSSPSGSSDGSQLEGYYAIHLRLRSQGLSEADTAALKSATATATLPRPPLAATAALIAATSPVRSRVNSNAGGKCTGAGAPDTSRLARHGSSSSRMFEYMANDARPGRTLSREYNASRLGMPADDSSPAATTAATSDRTASDHGRRSSTGGNPECSKPRSRICSKTCLLLLLLAAALAAVVLGVGLGVGLKQRRDRLAAAAAAGQPLVFQIGASVPAETAEIGCGRWFGSEKRVTTFKEIISTAYANVLAMEVDPSFIGNITCGGTRVQLENSLQGLYSSHTNGSSTDAAAATAAAAALRPMPTIRKLHSASVLAPTNKNNSKAAVTAGSRGSATAKPSITASTAGYNPELSRPKLPTLLSDVAPPATSYLNTVQILFTMTLPAATLNRNRADISKAVITTSDNILGGSLRRFFGVPTISIRAVVISAGTSVYAVRPSVHSGTGGSNPPPPPPAAAAVADPDAAAAPVAPASAPVSKDTAAAKVSHSGSSSSSSGSTGARDKDVLRTMQTHQQQQQQHPAKPAAPAAPPAAPASKPPKNARPAPVTAATPPPAATTAEAPATTASPQQQQQQQQAGTTAPTAVPPSALQQHVDAVIDDAKQDQTAGGVQSDVATPTAADPGAAVALQPSAATANGEITEQVDSGSTADPTDHSTPSQPADATSALLADPDWQDASRSPIQTQPDAFSGAAKSGSASSPTAPSLDPAGVYFPYGSFNLADFDRAPTCDFAPTAGNSLADKLGRLWSYMDGKECVFRAPRETDLLRTGSTSNTQVISDSGDHTSGASQGTSGPTQVLTWDNAPLCAAKPNILNSVVDSQGNLWGWESEKSCAFRGYEVVYTPTYDYSPADGQSSVEVPTNDNSLAARLRKAGPKSQPVKASLPASRPAQLANPLADWFNSLAALTQRAPSINSFAALKQRPPNTVETVWENAVACNAAPTKNNTVPDRFGRLWGWVEGKVCAFKYNMPKSA